MVGCDEGGNIDGGGNDGDRWGVLFNVGNAGTYMVYPIPNTKRTKKLLNKRS